MNRALFPHIATLIAFVLNLCVPVSLVHAEELRLPKPGVMVHLSPEFNAPILKGIKVYVDNPLKLDFILDKGDSDQDHNQLKEESSKLIKYFLASITTPEQDLWVNLSPYEKDKIVPQSFGQTEMGRDLLAQDYMLKQITASLIYPEDEVGKKFWKRIYEQAAQKYGTTNIPVNTFNKVWIVPEKAVVYENAGAGTAYVVESKLKVMLEGDYLALENNVGARHAVPVQDKDVNQLGSQIVREIVIPELTKEVNEGQNFIQLRQVYNSLILANWYKKKVKDSMLTQVYADKNKVEGVSITDQQDKNKIYQQYLQAFKKGVYNYIKDEVDPATQQSIPRKYFSGGVNFKDQVTSEGSDFAMNSQLQSIQKRVFIVRASLVDPDSAMSTNSDSNKRTLKQRLGDFMSYLRGGRTSHNTDDHQILFETQTINQEKKLRNERANRRLLIETIGEKETRLLVSMIQAMNGEKNPGEALQGEIPLVGLEDIKKFMDIYKEHLKEMTKENSSDTAYAKAQNILINALHRDSPLIAEYFNGRNSIRFKLVEDEKIRSLEQFLVVASNAEYLTSGRIEYVVKDWPDLGHPHIVPGKVDRYGKIETRLTDIFEDDVSLFYPVNILYRGTLRSKEDINYLTYGVSYEGIDEESPFYRVIQILKRSIDEANKRVRDAAMKVASVIPESLTFSNSKSDDETKGGIDFTVSNTPLEIKNSGQSIVFHNDPAMLQKLQNTNGFVPVINSFYRISDGEPGLLDLKTFLGLK